MDLTVMEHRYLAGIDERRHRLTEMLSASGAPSALSDIGSWYRYLAAIKAIQGNTSNDLSFVACLLAKDYLLRMLPMQPFDVAAKPQGAPGLDIDERTTDGRRVIGEVKTTTPYQTLDLGAAQRTSFLKDFHKLTSNTVDFRYFFVTDERTFEFVIKKYAHHIPGVTVVLLRGER